MAQTDTDQPAASHDEPEDNRDRPTVIANPALMAIKCQTPEQMALVNTLCWVAEAGRAGVLRAIPTVAYRT